MINLRLEDNEIYLSVKNVANYALNEDATELVERFKRADTARHTEGSGLGLAIAASVADLHQGDMTIDVDGDLFKVVVRHILKPLTPLHAALQKAATGDLTANVDEARLTNDEIGMVTKA